MSKLTLYILREFIVPLFYCLVGFIGIYILFELFGSFSRLLGSDLSFKECVLYFGGYLSPFFHYLASAAMMLATLYTMWNFCRHSELTAMRASGISLFAIVKPLLFAGAMMGLFIAWVSESYMPEYAQWAKKKIPTAKKSATGINAAGTGERRLHLTSTMQAIERP